MKALKEKNLDIRENLIDDFLCAGDTESIHLLLNMYNLENNIKFGYPNYSSLKELRRDVSRILKRKDGNQFVALNLSQLIHEDLNRLELLVYVEGYKLGYESHKFVNMLENIILKDYTVRQMYEKKYLIQFNLYDDEIARFRDYVNKCMNADINKTKLFRQTVFGFINSAFKPKVFHLNKYTDKQLSIEYASTDIININDENSFLNRDELRMIYKKLSKFVYRNMLRLYKEAFWNGMNDKLQSRYK